MNSLTPELYCTDIERSLRFYIDTLGFHILYQRPEENFAYLKREDAEIMLEQLGPGRKWITAELNYPFGRGLNLQIAVSDAETLYGAITAANHPVFLPFEEKWYRRNDCLVGNRQFVIQDPDGYLLRFAQDLGSRPSP